MGGGTGNKMGMSSRCERVVGGKNGDIRGMVVKMMAMMGVFLGRIGCVNRGRRIGKKDGDKMGMGRMM
ncbi:hypothetical protein, partial [Bacillus altitudinis]|uniref:hypothetical protein n=1 Tax=Bacillus altitudinis TaxID=293387 RepID=UPI001C92E102